MDLAEFLRNSGTSASSVSDTGSIDGGQSGENLEGREAHFNQKRNNPLGSLAERRAIRASETKDRRTSKRGQRFEKNRAIIPEEAIDEQDENRDINLPTEEKQKSRREKLEEFRKKKQQETEMNKRKAKPAFKTGKVQHPIAPFGAGAHKPITHGNTTNNRTRAAGNLTTRSNMSTVSVASSKSSVQKQTGDRNVVKQKRFTRKQTMKTPAIVVKPASGSSSAGSTGSRSLSSFAPENFQFQPLHVPNISTPLEFTTRKVSSPNLDSIPKLGTLSESEESSSDEVFFKDDIKANARKSGRKSRSKSIASPVKDPVSDLEDAQNNLPNENEDEEMATNENEEEITAANKDEEEITAANKDVDQESELTIPKPMLNDGFGIEMLTPDRGRARTRRSRRFSGVQPDPSIPDTELAKTPARRVKERSLSSTRRSAMLSCVCCDSPEEHAKRSPARTPRRSTPMKTPRTSSKVSRKSVLPMVSESSPSNDEYATANEEVVDVKARSGRRKSRSQAKIEHKEVEEGSSQDEETPSKVVEVKRRSTRRSSRPLPMVEVQEKEPQAVEIELKSPEKTAEVASTEKEAFELPLPATPQVSTPEQAPEEVVFKTPLPATSKRKFASAAKMRFGASPSSPWIEDRNRRSVKRKYSLSETKPGKSSLLDLFQDVPTEDSPLHDVLAKKFRSSDHVNETEVEEILRQFKAQRLSDQFMTIGNEYTQQIEKEKEENQGAGQKAGDAIESTKDSESTEAVEAMEVSQDNRKPADIQSDVTEETVEVVAQAKAVEGQEESEHDVPYFRKLLESETTRITVLCDGWEAKVTSEVPENIQGQIRTVVGQGRLVMAQRFKQFSGLVDNCEFGTGEKTTSFMDLQGFWEMIYFQVEDVDQKFAELAKVEANGWKEIELLPKPVAKKKTAPRKPLFRKPAVSGLRAHILAQKAAKAAEGTGKDDLKGSGIDDNKDDLKEQPKKPSIKDMIAAKRAALAKQPAQEEVVSRPTPQIVVEPADHTQDQDAEKSFDGGFFNIKSPVRPETRSPDPSLKSPGLSSFSPRSTKSTGGDRLRRAVLTDSARRMSGIISPYVSQMARRSLAKDSNAETSPEDQPVRDSRRSELFADMEDEDSTAQQDIEATEAVTTPEPTYDTDDPIVPMSSPVTKTYGKTVEHSEHEQVMDAAFDLLVSTPAERVLDGAETPTTKSNSAIRSSKRKGSQSVKFTEQTENPTGSISVTSTPHPRTRRSTRAESKKEENENKETDENINPNIINFLPSPSLASSSPASPSLRKVSRVSLLPGLELPRELAVPVSPSQDLMSFSPASRSTRRSSVQKP